MRSVEFHVDTLEAVERSQPVEVEYIYDSTEDRDQIGIFFEVHDEFDVPVATACLYGMHIRKGRNRVTAKYDFSMLAAMCSLPLRWAMAAASTPRTAPRAYSSSW